MDYIANDNPEVANKVAMKILEITRMLSAHPAMGRTGRVPGTREMVISGTPYIISYRVVDDEVQIIRVLHAARKWPDKF